MEIRIGKWSDGSESKTYMFDFKEIEDLDTFNPYSYKDGDVHIDLDYCPFCEIRGMLNRDSQGWYGWCSICDCKGPHHWDWIKAAKMWNARSLKDYAEARGETKEKFISRLVERGFDVNRISSGKE